MPSLRLLPLLFLLAACEAPDMAETGRVVENALRASVFLPPRQDGLTLIRRSLPAGSIKDADEADVTDGWSVQVPAGTWHDIVNTGEEDMRLYVVYAPVHHAAGIVQQTAEDAERDEESGTDEPPAWSAQPDDADPDERA